MTADIHIHEDNVEVTGGPLSVQGRVDAVGGLGVRNDDGRVLFRVVDQSMHDRVDIHLGDRGQGRQPSEVQVTIASQDNTAYISSRRASGFDSVAARAISGRQGRFQTLELGAGEPGEDGGHDGLIVLRNDEGQETVRIDGATGEVVLAAIGSLTETISALQEQVAALQTQVEELGGNPGGGGGAGGGAGPGADAGGGGADGPPAGGGAPDEDPPGGGGPPGGGPPGGDGPPGGGPPGGDGPPGGGPPGGGPPGRQRRPTR